MEEKDLKEMSDLNLRLLLASGIKGREYKQVMQEYTKRKLKKV